MGKIKVYYTFGKSISRAAMMRDWNEVAELHNGGHDIVGCREFNTEEEADAYCLGVADGNGWAESYYLMDDEAEKLIEIIGEENIHEPLLT